MTLLVFKVSEEENAAVAKEMGNFTYWLGALREEGSEFRWLDGSPWNFTSWSGSSQLVIHNHHGIRTTPTCGRVAPMDQCVGGLESLTLLSFDWSTLHGATILCLLVRATRAKLAV